MSQVSSIKLVEFLEDLCSARVISQEVKDIFSVLDDTVKPKLRLRYLLLQVCDGVKHDVTIFHRFVNVLIEYGGRMEEVAKCLGEEWCVSERGEEGHERISRQEVGSDIYLLQEDVTALMQILVEVSDKWELLGTALGLPKHILSDCSKASSNAVSMADILREWISRNPQEKKTLKKLQLALDSELVGRRAIAQILRERFIASRKPPMMFPVAKTPDLASILEIVRQSNNTVVADGKSTLLEAEVRESEALYHQWKKDGQALSDNIAYYGVHTAILAINPASQRTQGKFICHIMKGNEKVISREILLTVTFSPEKKHLIHSYSKDSDVPEDSWPPQVISTFINLVLIKKSKGVTDDYKYSVRGDVDDILETKEKVEFATVFGEYASGALVLVEGRPGSGKTTLVHKVARDWATGGEVLKNAELVYLIPLRSVANRETRELSDILDLIYLDKKECEKVVSNIKQAKGEGVCFIIDGLDEFHPQDETKSVIHQLLYEKFLPEAMVIVASRPVATDKLRSKPHVTRRIEVLGFSCQQIFDYIDNYPFTSDTPNSDTSPSQLKAYLISHHNILHMCYLPVHVAMICFLYQHEKGVIPRTETKIYEHFTRFIVLRKQRRSNEEAHLNSLDDLRGDDKEYFSSICDLAFDMTIHSTQTVRQRESKVQLFLGTGPKDAPSLGLLTIDRTSCLGGLDNTFAFLHLTFQEYLAARHLAKLKKKEQMKMIKLHAGETNMLMVWKFYSGMVKFENNGAQIQLIIKSARDAAGHAGMYGVQCAYESQQLVVCNNIVKGIKGKLTYRNYTLTLADMTAIGYVISTTSHPITELDMAGCYLHDDHVRTLLREVSHNKLKYIKDMRFHLNNIGDGGAVALADGLNSCNNLQILWLSTNNINAEGVVALVDGLKSCNNLQFLTFSNNNIGDEGAIALVSGLKSCSNLQNLYLRKNNIGDEGAVALADGLKSCNNLQFLNLADNKIGDDGAVALADGLKSCSNLQELFLSNNNIGDGGAVALADGLKSCSNLQKLFLRTNNIGDDGAVALADGLKSCSNLQHLYLSDNNIDAEVQAALRVRQMYPSLRL